MTTVYMDGVFDLFHVGHLEAIQQCNEIGKRVIIGVVGDDDAICYKRLPIIPQLQRESIITNIKGVDKVVCPCPLILTRKFIHEHNIDIVVHGFINNDDETQQLDFFRIPKSLGIFRTIKYSTTTNTTEIIQRIKDLL